jgi:predicted homoserine dehydrogenase-like protein
LVDSCDLIVECSGDVSHAATVVETALAAGLPVVTMNAEFQVTVGSRFVGQGVLTEAEGDQPGCLAALCENALQMGFRPLVYGNLKGFLNPHPTPKEMGHWARQQGISLRQVTSFTDGTKLQIEQALVANGLDAALAQPGLIGPATDDLGAAARQLAGVARRLHQPISDYVLRPGTFPGVFLVAEHDAEQQPYLRYLKLGDGPDYVLTQTFHLCHLEIIKTIRRVLRGEGPLLNNSRQPRFGVQAVAKQPLPPKTLIRRGIGSFDVRGVAVPLADLQESVPIGLLENAIVTRRIEPDSPVTWDCVELPETRGLDAWRELCRRPPAGRVQYHRAA